MTKGATQFLQPLTVSALTQNHVYGELFSLTDESDMGHIRLARDADAVLVAPASADFMAKIAMGIADDLASTVILATQAPIWIAPAMNPQMYANAATQHNITVLQNRGINIIPPDTGEAACGEHGIGRMSDPQQIIDIITKKSHPLNNKIILLTVGATREAIDPIRFISNGSSGQMGYAMALVAAQMGAKVTVLEAHTSHPRPVHHNITFEKTSSAEEMLNASLYHTKNTMFDYAVFVAAVADFTPENYSPQKLDKQKLSQISLRHTVDILNKIATLPTQQRPKKVIGFAAQTDHRTERMNRQAASLLSRERGEGLWRWRQQQQ